MLLLSIFADAFVSTKPWHRRHVKFHLSSAKDVFENRWINMSSPFNQETILEPVLLSTTSHFDSTLQNQFEEFDPFRLEEMATEASRKPSWQGLTVSAPTLTSPQPKKDGPKLAIWAARALLLLVAMLWGTNFASVKYLETICLDPPCVHLPSEAALARFGVAAAVSIPLLLRQPWPVIAGGLECGIWITMGYITQAMALPYIDSGKCAFICSLTVVLVPLLSAIFFGKEIKPVHFVSAAMALAGVGVLEGMLPLDQLLGLPTESAGAAATASSALESSSLAESGTDILSTLSKTLGVGKGDILALGQPLGFGLAFMRIEHYVEKFKDIPNRIITISAAQCVAVGLLAFFWVMYDFQGHVPDFGYMVSFHFIKPAPHLDQPVSHIFFFICPQLEPHRLVAIMWTGIMTTVVAIYLEGVALETCSASEAALTFSSEPVWASMFGAWLLRERLNTNSYVGGAVILMACILGALADIKPSKDKSTLAIESLEADLGEQKRE
jgi:drug/metabolite transporter (DMT)-like permease